MIGATPNVLVVGSGVPAKDAGRVHRPRAQERRPHQLRLGRPGLAHAPDDGAVQAGDRRLHGAHPYRGIAPAFNDLLGGQTQAMFPGLAAALPHLRSGRVRALAVTGRARSPQAAGRADARGIGLQGFDAMQWYGSVGPAGLPPTSCAA
jgi:hypothetical protein